MIQELEEGLSMLTMLSRHGLDVPNVWQFPEPLGRFGLLVNRSPMRPGDYSISG
jgi:hypothetical protein